MQLNRDYSAVSNKIKQCLNLSGSPVAIKIITSKDQIPDGINEIQEPARHCKMISLARNGDCFYATDSKHQCGGGAWTLGLRQIGDKLKSGEHYYNLGKYGSIDSCIRTMNCIPHLPLSTYATLYSPLESAKFTPNVVIIFATPAIMLKLAQTLLYRLGGRIYPQFSGIQSFCSDLTAYVILNGKANFSVGCDGSRKFSGIANEEMAFGFPIELIDEIADTLPIIV
ncbi:MAG TPA: DUF169 domain-containing protein, partial [Methanocorpusculum sp.]|nr:DUF169 domain-containing protein [Methanocorpusculum sp.]